MTGGDANGKIGDSTIAAITAERVAEAMSDARKGLELKGKALIVEPMMEGISAWIDAFQDDDGRKYSTIVVLSIYICLCI